MNKAFYHILFGYFAGIVAGASYGMNPLFAKPLLESGVSVPTMLIFRYDISALLMALFIMYKQESFRVSFSQMLRLIPLGVLFGLSSIFLFESYHLIPSGLATVLVYLYPFFTVLVMISLGDYPNWQTPSAVFITMLGVAILCFPQGDFVLNWKGILFAITSACTYSLYLVVVNKSKKLGDVAVQLLTFYVLLVGVCLFVVYHFCQQESFLQHSLTIKNLFCLLGLSIFPTTISMSALAFSTRAIGATRTSVLGVFEPVTAIAIGVYVFSEPLTLNILIGVSICIFAILLMVLGSRK